MKNKALTTEEFITRSIVTHGSRYDYSCSVYVNQNTPIKIECKEHGVFEQLPTNHYWHGNHCPKCGRKQRAAVRTIPAEVFITEAQILHKNKYRYDTSSYTNRSSKMRIWCPDHGWFDQTPDAHLNQGQGCPHCAGKHITQHDVIDTFRKVHGDKYDYSTVIYHTAHTKVEIGCPNHGIFLQTPAMHQQGQGCPRCAYSGHLGKYSDRYFSSNPEKTALPGYLYLWKVQNDSEIFLKVGMTRTDVDTRIRNNHTTSYNISPIFTTPLMLKDAFHIEQEILKEFAASRYVPNEYFQGTTECLQINKEQDIINSIQRRILCLQK